MRLPAIQGEIERRILVNYRVDARVIPSFLPFPFKPKLVDGYAIAGICLIRLAHMRPSGFPAFIGIGSENAAHRIAVEWDQAGEPFSGVYIPRRDTSSPLFALAGGRIFPGVHHLGRFIIHESDQDYEIRVLHQNHLLMKVNAQVVDALPASSIFKDLAAASAFFESGSLGYSATNNPARYDGLELQTHQWQVQPLDVSQVYSHFFEDSGEFPAGSVEFDCALLMRNIPHEWHDYGQMSAQNTATYI
jgi:hypothetical protein